MGQQQAPKSTTVRSASRRRQRSTRLSVAVTLLAVAAVLVISSLVQDAAWLRALAAVSAVVLGAAATRITHSELMAARKEAARDRAQQAAEYAEISRKRANENAVFAKDMTKRIESREITIAGLEQALDAAQKQVLEQTRKLNAEARRADLAERTGADATRQLNLAEERAAEAIAVVSELEIELDVLRDELTTWRKGRGRASRTA